MNQIQSSVSRCAAVIEDESTIQTRDTLKEEHNPNPCSQGFLMGLTCGDAEIAIDGGGPPSSSDTPGCTALLVRMHSPGGDVPRLVVPLDTLLCRRHGWPFPVVWGEHGLIMPGCPCLIIFMATVVGYDAHRKVRGDRRSRRQP